MTEAAIPDSLELRAAGLLDRVESALKRSSRPAGAARILPISKKMSPERVLEAVACGFSVFGENRVQEAKQKIPSCPGHLEWHMVGHLQRNKVREAVRLFSMIHSVDSLRLLETIESCCEEEGKSLPVCLEVNVSGESCKYGLAPEDVPSVLERCNAFARVEVAGLMTMPPVTENAEGARRYFSRLREYRDKWCKQSGFDLEELSMGMSHDFEVAIEEGATWVRIGRALFGPRPPAPPPPSGTGGIQ